MEQTPLKEALDTLTSGESGEYKFKIPASVCFGVVALGGIVLSFVHKAAIDFTSKSPKSAKHRHVQQLSANFFRPSLAAPQETTIRIEIANANRGWTTLHYQTLQNGKPCTAGYVLLTDFTTVGTHSASTGWHLIPPPKSVSLEALGADREPSWVSYLTPWLPKGFRNAQSYVRWHLPVDQPHSSFVDQWMSPGWPQDEPTSVDAVWTDELVHFLVDSVFPLLQDLMRSTSDRRTGTTLYADTIASGLLQRRLRSEGKDDRVIGVRMGIEEMVPWIQTTLTMSTEIKKTLPKEGVKWLFLRTELKYLLNDRMGFDITVLDQSGDLVASSQQIFQAVPMSKKNAKKASI